MRTPPLPRVRMLAPIAALLLAGAACGGDDGSSDTSSPTSVASAPTDAPSSTATPAPDATADIPAVPDGTADIPLPPASSDIPLSPIDSSDVPLAITVTVGFDSRPDRIEQVPLGSTVSITITNEAADDEFHLHGYELGDGTVVPAGQSVTFTFTATQAGDFELESHTTDSVLLVVRVA